MMPVIGRARVAGQHDAQRAAGFTLLELLVVIFIIGVLATMFTLSVGITGGDQDIERELDRLYALLQLASEEATLQGRELGLRFRADGYEFAAYEEAFDDYPDSDPEEGDLIEVSEWQVLTQGTALVPRRLPPGIEIELEIDGRALIIEEDDSEKDDDALGDDGYRPQVFIFSSGEISPFVVQLRRAFENEGDSLEVKADGTIELLRGAR